MLKTAAAMRGMVTAPHHLAAESGLAVLREGGNAIEAMVAAAATIAVAYPHMNSLGGDGFWLIKQPDTTPVAIRACGPTGQAATAGLYHAQGLAAIPTRGPLAANTVAGTIAGWQQALGLSTQWGGRMPLARLLEDAIYYAEQGIAASGSQCQFAHDKLAELQHVPGFAATFAPNGQVPQEGERFCQPRLAATLKSLAERGLDDFYRGALAARLAADLARIGSPVSHQDLADYHAEQVTPLSVRLRSGTVYNHPPPTQGLASLLILGLFDRLDITAADDADYIHALVECTKQAFLVRDREVTDPRWMHNDPARFLQAADLHERVQAIARDHALSWSRTAESGDTVWLGAIDGHGNAISFIQSIYWEFGSGVVLDETGILWQNRGSSFTLAPGAHNRLEPGRQPFHTLNPALAELHDGRVMVYGTMGGDGQPQTQAAVYTRYAHFGQELQQAINAPRWLLGRAWGTDTTALRLESRIDQETQAALTARGHQVEVVGAYDDLMGHAGALVRHPSGLLEGASDPRCDGRAAGF